MFREIFLLKILHTFKIRCNFAHVQNIKLSLMNEIELKQLKPALPHGAIGMIAEKAELSTSEVSKMFRGYESKHTEKVKKITVEYLQEISAKLHQTV